MSDYCLRKNGTVCVNPERCHALLVDVLDHCEDQHVCDGANAALEALKALHGGSDVAENLKKEALLSCEFWALLVRRIADAGTDGLAICTTIREHIRAIGTLKGPAATVPAATVLGRAVTRQQLADTFTLNQYYPTAEDALAHLDKLERKTLRHFQRAWGDFDLGRFVMWSTFDAAGNPPFSQLPKVADHIRGKLGLDPAEAGRPMLILQYRLPGPEAHMPTIAEAYAGDTWHRYFRTASGHQVALGYGITQPWPSIGGLGLPEVVHRPVKGSLLTEKPEEVR